MPRFRRRTKSGHIGLCPASSITLNTISDSARENEAVDHTDLRLRADGLDFWVDVHLHHFGPRWLAVADLSGDAEVGWGNRPAAAIAMVLTSLGADAQERLMAAAQKLLVDRHNLT